MNPKISHPPTRKEVSLLRSRLLGAAMVDPRWHLAVLALEKSIAWHDGQTRKDGQTPYVRHPVQVAQYVLTLPNLRHRIETVCAALLHDVMEDCGVTQQELEAAFGSLVGSACASLCKKTPNMTKDNAFVMNELGGHVVASVVKGADRINNQLTLEVFTPAKALATVDFTEQNILPMLKRARREFSDQELAYENIKMVLTLQIRSTRALFAASTENPAAPA